MNLRLLVLAAFAGIAFASPAFAQFPPGCLELCAVSCIKPISITDRWDDVTPIPGYAGEPGRPNWRNNSVFNQESFTDLNSNQLWDPGEPFLDSNANGTYDRENFDPLLTGYVADPLGNPLAPAGDLGLEITLQPGQYYSIDLPAVNRGTPIDDGDVFRDNLATCNPAIVGAGDLIQPTAGRMSGPLNQAFRDFVAQDPDAYWDPATKQISGSAFPPGESPRILRVPAHDPRIFFSSATGYRVVATKVVALFIEQNTGEAVCLCRFLRTSGNGETCAGTTSAGFVIACATPATPTSWGRMKGIYR